MYIIFNVEVVIVSDRSGHPQTPGEGKENRECRKADERR